MYYWEVIKMEKKEIEFKIVKHIADLTDPSEKGWKKEVNLVQWNGGKTKLDIRDWNQDHTRCGKGASLSSGECDILYEALDSVGEF